MFRVFCLSHFPQINMFFCCFWSYFWKFLMPWVSFSLPNLLKCPPKISFVRLFTDRSEVGTTRNACMMKLIVETQTTTYILIERNNYPKCWVQRFILIMIYSKYRLSGDVSCMVNILPNAQYPITLRSEWKGLVCPQVPEKPWTVKCMLVRVGKETVLEGLLSQLLAHLFHQ